MSRWNICAGSGHISFPHPKPSYPSNAPIRRWVSDTEETMADFVEEGGAGELSKNAAKKAAKAAEAAKAKAEKEAAKAAAAAAAPPKTAKLGEEVEELDPTKYYENRLTQIAAYEVRAVAALQFQ